MSLQDASSNLNKIANKAGVEAVDVGTTAGNLIRGALSVVGLLFFLLIFYGGFTWMTARGNEEQIKKSRNTVVAAAIGLVIVLAAYALTSLVGGIIG